jgi:hypothetical protein
VEKRIDPARAGRTDFFGRQTTMLTDLPSGYTSITSGWAMARPPAGDCAHEQNDQVVAMLELASFRVFQDYQINFLEKCGEFVASALAAGKTTERCGFY